MKRSGTADLPLHGGRGPPWLADRMTLLGTAIVKNIIHHCGASSCCPGFQIDSGLCTLPFLIGLKGLERTVSTTVSRVRVLRLFDWPRTRDKDVHESLGALLPVWAGRNAWHFVKKCDRPSPFVIFLVEEG